MIRRKPTAIEAAQGVGTALTFAAVVMLLPLAWALLIIGLVIVGVATYAERQQHASAPDEPEPVVPAPMTDGG